MPEEVVNEAKNAAETYEKVRDESAEGEEFEVEYGDTLYKAKVGSDGILFYRAPNSPEWKRGAVGAFTALADGLEAVEVGVRRAHRNAGSPEQKAAFSVFAFVAVALVAASVGGAGLSDGGSENETVASNTTEYPVDVTVESTEDAEVNVSGFDAEEAESLVLENVNAVRARNGAPPTSHVDALSEAATEHARNMAEHDYVGHVTPSHEDVWDRYSGSCERGTESYGENAASAPFGEELEEWNGTTLEDESDVSEFMTEAWMDSDGHRETMLDPDHAGTGVGVHLRDDGTVFAVQAFC